MGIALALLGSFFLAYASLKAGLESTLLFDQLVKDAPQLSPPWLHAAFVLLFIGYGTKMGLAPMHTWKPDAYGEAPGIVGTLLAGGVTSCAFLAILRVYQICRAGADAEFAREIMIFMGLLSMAVAAVFMVRQRDFKRMLAYSSVEHMGILVLGVGIGGLAVYGALLHLINNGLTKGVLFLSAGNIHRAYGSKLTDDVQGAIERVPLVRGAVPGRLPGHHGLAAVRPVRERVHHRERRGRQRAVRRRRAVPAPARRRVHRHGGHGAGRGPGEAAPEQQDRPVSRQREHRRPDPPVHGPRAAAGPLYPASPGIAAARGRRVLGGEAMNANRSFAALRTGQAVPRAQVPQLPFADFRGPSSTRSHGGQRVAALFGDVADSSGDVDLYAVLADSARAAACRQRRPWTRTAFPR